MLLSSSGNPAKQTTASIKSVIEKEISSHVCKILKEEQVSVLGIRFAPKMPLFKAQSSKSATPSKITFYNDWEKRQRQSKMITLPLMSTTLEWRFNSYFQMPFKLDGKKRLHRQSRHHILYVEKNAQYFAQELLVPALSIKVFVRWRSSLFPIYIDGEIFWSNLSWISNNLHKRIGVIFST